MSSEYEVLTREDVMDLSYELASMIRSSGYEFDVIVGIARGGRIPARILCDLLQCDTLGTMRVRFYADVGKFMDKPVIEQDLNVDVKGKRVLLVDELVDTGKSLKVAIERVKEYEPKELKVATYHIKPRTEIIPDFYVTVTDKRVVYPREYVEFTNYLIRKYGKRGKILAEMLGIPRRALEFVRFFRV